MFARGCVPDDPARKGHVQPWTTLHRKLGAPIPRGSGGPADYRPTKRFDQNGDPSCTAHAWSLAVYETCAAAGRALPSLPSPSFMWAASLALDNPRVPGPDGNLPKLPSAGVQSVSVMLAAGTIGMVPLGELVPGRYSDCAGVRELPADLAEAAANALVTGEYSIDPAAADCVDQVCLALDLGIAVYAGVQVSRLYDSWRASMGPLNDAEVGGTGHAIVFDRYETAQNGERILYSPGSYGNGTADNGVWTVTGAWLRANAFDVYPMAVKGVHYA